MANTIKHKRGSGSNPGASDLAVGEIAIRTDTGVLFTKKDDNSVAAISGGSTNLGVSTTSSAVTVTSSTGDNATISEASGSAAGVMSTAHHDKLDGIEANATADQTAAEILTAIKTVDGASSGLDADLLDGVEGSSFVRSDANDSISGDITFSGASTFNSDVRITDDDKLRFGTSSGGILQIYTNGTNSFFKQTSGDLKYELADQFIVQKDTGDEPIAIFNSDADVELYHDGAKKFETKSDGIDVTGEVQCDSLDVDGAADISGNITCGGTVDGRDLATDGTKLDGIEANATADQSASEILTAIKTVDGASSGLDADLLDGQHGSHYLDYNNFSNTPTIPTNNNQLTNGAGYITATLTNEQVQDIVGGMVSGNSESGISVTYQDGDGTLDFSVTSQTDNNFTTTLKNKLDGIESGATADQSASEILTAIKTVDGSSSGLDADLLDGVHGSSFVRSDANDSISGDISFNGDVDFTGASYSAVWDTSANRLKFNDNAKAVFGNGSDLEIYHDGSDSHVRNTVGDLFIKGEGDDVIIRANDDVLIQAQNGEDGVKVIGNGAVELYHNNSKKLETTSSGISATGNIAVSGGIDFSADSNAAGATTEVLDDYERGTWTPVYRGSSSAGSYSPATSAGVYVKVGNVVYASASVLNISGSGGSGDLQITGFPFANDAGQASLGHVFLDDFNMTNTAIYLVAIMGSTDSHITIREVKDTAADTTMSVTDLDGSNSDLVVTITYIAA